MRILALEPYYGGSHKAFLDGWVDRSAHQWQLMTLPPYHWKWRMRHGAIWLAHQVRTAWRDGARWDVVVCTDMLDLAQFQGLVGPPVAGLPTVVYFHENQLTYPTRVANDRDLHFAFTNFSTAVAADRVWFNSDFHRREFLDGAAQWLHRMPDYVPQDELAAVVEKSDVQSPGIEVPATDDVMHAQPMRIAWAARWEHDKDPEAFFTAVRLLKQQTTDFRLAMCGQSFRETPAVFADARDEFSDHIEHWGYIAARSDYLRTLSGAHVIVSTAAHEFFGLAVMEGIALGLYPLLPRRLSYPELLNLSQSTAAEAFFYDGSPEHLARRLVELAEDPALRSAPEQRAVLREASSRYQWPHRVRVMDAALEALT